MNELHGKFPKNEIKLLNLWLDNSLRLRLVNRICLDITTSIMSILIMVLSAFVLLLNTPFSGVYILLSAGFFALISFTTTLFSYLICESSSRKEIIKLEKSLLENVDFKPTSIKDGDTLNKIAFFSFLASCVCMLVFLVFR